MTDHFMEEVYLISSLPTLLKDVT